MFEDMITKLKKNSEWIVAALVLIEVTQFVGHFFGQNLPFIGEFFALYSMAVLSITSLLSLILLVFLGYLLRKEHGLHLNKEQALDEAVDVHRKAMLALKESLGEKIEQLQDHNAALMQFRERFNSCSQTYRTLAKQNALCDWWLFRRLFLDLQTIEEIVPGKEENYKLAVADALQTTRENIKTMLNKAMAVFTVHTGRRCAVCIQLLQRVEGRTIDDALIVTVQRDEDSREGRGLEGHPHRVGDNTLHRRIYVGRERAVVENDLLAADRDGRFQTSSHRWREFYNAILIVQIPNMSMEAAEQSQPAADRDEPDGLDDVPRATLCIDNFGGGLDGPVQMHVAKELAWRLGVMLYRLDALESALEAHNGAP